MSEQGLIHKYNVFKEETGEQVTDCFVLRPEKDDAARIAMLAYARATWNDALAQDIRKWMEQKTQNGLDDETRLRFFYCDSEDSYLLGQRLHNFFYARWDNRLGFVWQMSRYLPWGEHVIAPNTLWKEHTYCSEPREIGQDEWFKGFIAQQIALNAKKAFIKAIGDALGLERPVNWILKVVSKIKRDKK